MHLSCRRGHSARENNDALRNVLFLQDVEQPKESQTGYRHSRIVWEYTNFRIVFTPTLFSSEKNMNI